MRLILIYTYFGPVANFRRYKNEADALISIASERAKERQIRKPSDFVMEPVPQQNGSSTARDEVGAQLGVSGRTVSDLDFLCAKKISLRKEISDYVIRIAPVEISTPARCTLP